MHELSYMIRLADMALDELNQEPDRLPEALVVEVGELTGVEAYYLMQYYPKVVQNTRLSGSKLIVCPVEAEALCEDCGQHYHPEKTNDYRCPDCSSLRARFVHGRELSVREIRLHDL